jgi:acetylglutamate kinase
MSQTNKPIIVIKYGGNAMTEESLKTKVLQNICQLQDRGFHVVIVHGGGPFIQKILGQVNIQSEFIDGHRKTTKEALKYVEMALKGEVNSSLVSILNQMGQKAVGLSGKDGRMAIAQKRFHHKNINGKIEKIDIGQVGDITEINTDLISLLLQNNFLPVVTCIAADNKGNEYNINADMFAGNMAGALSAKQFIILTDVDGLLMDKDDPSTIIRNLSISQTNELISNGTIQGGMIPKIESCIVALNSGAKSSRIINGTKPSQITQLAENKNIGTTISK